MALSIGEVQRKGNPTIRYVDEDSSGTLNTGDTDISTYVRDYRNRLTALSHFDTYTDYTGEDPDQVVQYGYDYKNRLVRKVLDSDGDGNTDSSTVFSFVPSGPIPGTRTDIGNLRGIG